MRKQFQQIDGYSSHRPLLFAALQNTDCGVVEFGAGEGSTPLLREYCTKSKRGFESYESNTDYAIKNDSILVHDWDEVSPKFAVYILFLDHAPGERRVIDLIKYKAKAKIIIIHDTENAEQTNPLLHRALNSFKYRIDYTPDQFAHTTAVSDYVDVTKWEI